MNLSIQFRTATSAARSTSMRSGKSASCPPTTPSASRPDFTRIGTSPSRSGAAATRVPGKTGSGVREPTKKVLGSSLALLLRCVFKFTTGHLACSFSILYLYTIHAQLFPFLHHANVVLSQQDGFNKTFPSNLNC